MRGARRPTADLGTEIRSTVTADSADANFVSIRIHLELVVAVQSGDADDWWH
jgi:hypothetical protein